MNGSQVEGPEPLAASSFCHSTPLPLGRDAECPIVSGGADCISGPLGSIGSDREHPRSMRPEARWVKSEESLVQVRIRSNRCFAVGENILGRFNCPTARQRNAENLESAVASSLVGVFCTREQGFYPRVDGTDAMSNVVLRRLCLNRFILGSDRQVRSSRSAVCYTPQETRMMGSEQ